MKIQLAMDFYNADIINTQWNTPPNITDMTLLLKITLPSLDLDTLIE